MTAVTAIVLSIGPGAQASVHSAETKIAIGPEPWVLDRELAKIGKGRYWTFQAKLSSIQETRVVARAEEHLREGLKSLDDRRLEILSRARESLGSALADSRAIRALIVNSLQTSSEGRTQIVNLRIAHANPDIALAVSWAVAHAFVDFHLDRVREPVARHLSQIELANGEYGPDWSPRSYTLPFEEGYLDQRIKWLRSRITTLELLVSDLQSAEARHAKIVPLLKRAPRGAPIRPQLQAEIERLRNRATATLLRLIERKASNQDQPQLTKINNELQRLDGMIDARQEELAKRGREPEHVDLVGVVEAKQVALDLKQEFSNELEECLQNHATVSAQLKTWNKQRKEWRALSKRRARLEQLLDTPLGPVRIFDLAHSTTSFGPSRESIAPFVFLGLLIAGTIGFLVWRKYQVNHSASRIEPWKGLSPLGPPIDPKRAADWNQITPILQRKESRKILLVSGSKNTEREAAALAESLAHHASSVALITPSMKFSADVHSQSAGEGTTESRTMETSPNALSIEPRSSTVSPISEAQLFGGPVESQSSDRVRLRLDELSAKFDFVVAGGDPIEVAGARALLLAANSDERILVMPAGPTPDKAQLAAATLLAQGNAPATGCVLVRSARELAVDRSFPESDVSGRSRLKTATS